MGGEGQGIVRAHSGSGGLGLRTLKARGLNASLSVPAPLHAVDRDRHLASRQRLTRQSRKMWPGCREGAGGLRGSLEASRSPPKLSEGFREIENTWLYLMQSPDTRCLRRLLFPPLPPAPGFPENPNQAGNTKKVSSSSYNSAPAPLP